MPRIVLQYGALGILMCSCEVSLFLMVLSHFVVTMVMDPGALPQGINLSSVNNIRGLCILQTLSKLFRAPESEEQDDFRTPLYKNVEISGINVKMKWCVTCHFYRPPRCSHCSACNLCIEVKDDWFWWVIKYHCICISFQFEIDLTYSVCKYLLTTYLPTWLNFLT